MFESLNLSEITFLQSLYYWSNANLMYALLERHKKSCIWNEFFNWKLHHVMLHYVRALLPAARLVNMCCWSRGRGRARWHLAFLETLGLLIPGDLSYLGTPHTWGPLIPGDPSYLGTPHTWGPLIPGDPSYLGTPFIPVDPSYLWTLFSSGDFCFFSHISHANWNIWLTLGIFERIELFFFNFSIFWLN